MIKAWWSGALPKMVHLLKRHFVVILVSLVLSFAYMGHSLTSCNTTVIGSIGGDNINGIIWLFTNTTKPYGGFSHVTNYPFGESVSQPQLITSAALMVPTWLAAKVVGPVCAWNTMVFAGYMSSALLMYGFVYWLLRRRGVALFAAVAVGFVPYHYWKTQGHLAYVQSELFIAILWAWLAFWKRPSRNKAILLGLLVSGLLYGDGYYPLIGGLMVTCLLSYSVIVDYIVTLKNKAARQLYIKKLGYLLISLLVLIAAFLPVGFVKYHYKDQINADIRLSRSDPKLEVETYGSHPIDYVLPSDTQLFPFLRSIADNYHAKHVYSVNGEYSMYIGMSVLLLAGIGVGVSASKLIRKTKRSPKDNWLIWVGGACLTIAVLAFFSSLAPSMAIFGVRLPWPSAIISSVVGYWRVFARLFLVLDIAMVTLAALGLWHILQKIPNKKYYRTGFVVIVIAIAILELMPVNPFSRHDEWNVTKGSPTYSWLSKQPEKAVAAYPLVEAPMGSSYFGDQLVHHKSLFNSYAANDHELLLHRSLTGLGDKQTLGVLKTLGINDLLLYRVNLPPDQSQNLTVQYGNYGARVAHISSTVQPLNRVLIPGVMFGRPEVDDRTQISCRPALGPIADLSIRRLDGKALSDQMANLSFAIKGMPGQSVIVYSQGTIYGSYEFQRENEVQSVNITVPEKAVVYVGHLSDPGASYASICNLGIND